jgi:uncharacterized repeat protein (TIGR01451 family)
VRRLVILCLVVLALLYVPAAVPAPGPASYNVTLTGPSTVQPGQSNNYTFRFTNDSTSPVDMGSVQISPPSGWSSVSISGATTSTGQHWDATNSNGVVQLLAHDTNQTLAPGQYVDTYVYAATLNTLGTNTWSTAAKSSIDFTTGDLANSGTDPSVTVSNGADLGVSITSDASGSLVAGQDSVTYTATVTNHGPADNTGYTLTFDTPANTTPVSLSGPSGTNCTAATGVCTSTSTLASGAHDTYTFKLAVGAAFADSIPTGATLTEHAVVSSPTPGEGSNTNPDSASTDVTVIAQADLGVSISSDHSTGSVVAGSDTTVTYTATVTNNGPSDNTAYTLTLDVPTNTTFVSLTGGPASGGSCGSPSGGTVVCTTGPGTVLAPSSNDTYTLKLKIGPAFADSSPTGKTLTEHASLSNLTPSDQGANTAADSDHTNVTVIAQADVGVSITSDFSSTNAVAGQDTVTFTATVTNHGPSDNTGYTLTLDVPANTTFVSLGKTTGSCDAPSGTTVTCSGPAVLAPSGTVTYTLKLKIGPAFADSNVLGTTLTEHASLSNLTPSNQGTNTNADSDSTDVTVIAQADLAISATVLPNGAPPAAHAVAGSSTPEDYTITVTNNGPSDAQGGYKVTAPLPAGTTLDSGSDNSCSVSSGTITCDRTTISTLTPSATDVFHVKLHVAPSFADNGAHQATLTPTFSLGSFGTPQGAGNTGNDSASPSVTVYAEADLAISATVSPNGAPPAAHAVAGSSTPEDYTITVTNNGPSDAQGGYKVTAPLPAGTTLDSGSDNSCSVSSGTITCDRTTISTLIPTAADVFHVKLDLAPSYGDASNTDQTPLTLALTLGSFGTPQPASSTGNDTANPSVTVYSESDLTITKTASSGPIYANGNTAQNTVTFTIVVSNLGPSDAHNVHVDDALNANLITNASYCQGASCTPSNAYSGSITIGTFTVSGSPLTFKVAAHANATLGHSTANSSPTDYRQPGPYNNSNTATIGSTTPGHSGANSRGPTAAVNTAIDTAPAPPAIFQAAVGGNAAGGAEWLASASGGQPVLSYTLKACPISGPGTQCVSRTVSATPNVTGNPSYFSYFLSAATNTALVNGTLYDFTIVATNAVGDSDPADAGTAYASTSAFLNTIPTTGALSADLGIQGGALTCTLKDVNCKNIVAQYAFTDKNHIGAVYNLDAEPDNSATNPTLQCLIVKTLDPNVAGFGTRVMSPDCGPSDKVIRATYPLSTSPTVPQPHLEQEQFDRSISTDTRGTPCFAYTVDSTGTAQCTDPALKPIYTDPNTGKPTNFCPAQFDPGNLTGWTPTKPCAFVYYLVAAIPGFDIIGDATHSIKPRPIACNSTDPNCGKSAIIGSSIRNGITEGSTQLVQPWCDKALTYVPCVSKYQWLNGQKTDPSYVDVLAQDYEVGDLLKGGSSG